MLLAHHLTPAPLPPLNTGGDFQPFQLFALLALVLALAGFVTTIRLWLNKALLDARDGIGKEGYKLKLAAGEADDSRKDACGYLTGNGYINELRDRVWNIGWQLRLLRFADVAVIAAGLLMFHWLFWEWMVWKNWRPARGWNVWVAGVQCFWLAVLILAGLYLAFAFGARFRRRS